MTQGSIERIEELEREVARLEGVLERQARRQEQLMSGVIGSAGRLLLGPDLRNSLRAWFETASAKTPIPPDESAGVLAAVIRRMVRVGLVGVLLTVIPTTVSTAFYLWHTSLLQAQIEQQAATTLIVRRAELLATILEADREICEEVAIEGSTPPRKQLTCQRLVNPQAREKALLAFIEIERSQGRAIDLRGAYLSNTNLAGSDLSSADLSNADLSGANLRDANLSSANLNGAVLQGATLLNAKLSNATLRDSTLQNADLRSADFSDADLRGANLSNADLKAANLTSAELVRSQLVEAELQFADLTNADLRFADLSEASLNYSFLGNGDFRLADFSNANLTGADLRNADLRGAELRGAILQFAEVQGADLQGADSLMNSYIEWIEERELDRLIHRRRLGQVTQDQILSAIGDRTTKLPQGLMHPADWPELDGSSR